MLREACGCGGEGKAGPLQTDGSVRKKKRSFRAGDRKERQRGEIRIKSISAAGTVMSKKETLPVTETGESGEVNLVHGRHHG